MKHFLLVPIAVFILMASSCKKEQGAKPYDPNTKITVDVNPKILSFTPASAKTGDTVTIKGKNFTGATAVNFGSKPAASFNVASDTTITAVVADGTSGTISVTNAKGTKALPGFIYIVPVVPTGNINLALNKPATASTSFNSPSLSVDGDISTRWSSLNEDNQWYMVDLLTVSKVNRVDIKWEGAYASDYALQVSTDGVNFTTVFSTTTSIGGDVSHPFATVDARYVKILLNKRALPYPCSFFEFEIYNDPPPVNLALNKTATASTSFNSPALSIDGDISTRWSSLNEDNQWYKVDLASVQNISRIDIYWEGAYASDYAIQVSTDDVNYTSVFATTAGTGGNESYKFNAVDARYVKILLNKRALPYPCSFWEFEVYKK